MIACGVLDAPTTISFLQRIFVIATAFLSSSSFVPHAANASTSTANKIPDNKFFHVHILPFSLVDLYLQAMPGIPLINDLSFIKFFHREIPNELDDKNNN